MKTKRAILLVLDSVGIGAAPDAANYGDGGANTLVHVAAAVGGSKRPTSNASAWAAARVW